MGQLLAAAPNIALTYGATTRVMDATEDGRRLKMLPIVDEFSRECLDVEVARHLTANDVVATLDRLFKAYGAPRVIEK